MKLIDQGHPFYRPLWRRLAIVGVTAAWAGFELLVSGDGLWIAISCGMLALSAWTFLIAWNPSASS
jgi:hypothetical protein